MMKNIQQVKAFAKLNLTLDVLGKRDDGFHELITIMQAIDLYDEISIEFTSKKAVSVAADFELPEGSVAFNAANEYMQRTGSGGANINIKGRIPPMAGLGGSSADGAAVLRAMQRHYGLMDRPSLYALAAQLGSDVPFLLEGGAAICRGRGERLEPISAGILAGLCYLVVKPGPGISTAQLFAGLRPPYAGAKSDEARLALQADDKRLFLSCISNALEPPAAELLPAIGHILKRLRRCGALAAGMSGSGSACFAVFDDKNKALAAAEGFADAGIDFCGVFNPISGFDIYNKQDLCYNNGSGWDEGRIR